MEIDGNTKEYYLKKYQTNLGFILVPDNIWKSLMSEQRKVILDHNGEKKGKGRDKEIKICQVKGRRPRDYDKPLWISLNNQ